MTGPSLAINFVAPSLKFNSKASDYTYSVRVRSKLFIYFIIIPSSLTSSTTFIYLFIYLFIFYYSFLIFDLITD